MPADSRKDDVIAAVGVLVLLIGTAAGNAYVLLGLSIGALVLMVAFGGRRLGRGALLVGFVAALTAALIGFVMAMRD